MRYLQMKSSQVLLHSIKYLKRNLYSSIYLTAATSTIKIHGNIFVSGRKINPVTFRENIAYVMQDDSLLATATPREALEFSAQLR